DQNKIDSLLTNGGNHLRAGKFELAVKSFEESLSLAVEKSDKKIQMDCYQNLGLLFWNLGRIDESSESYSKALKIAQELNLSQTIKICESAVEINLLYLEGKDIQIKKPQESKEIFLKAIDIANAINSQAHKLKCLISMSRIYFASGNQEYLDLMEQALGIARRLNHKKETMKLLNSIGSFQAQNNPAYALTNIFDALKIAEEINLKDMIHRYSYNLGNMYLKFGDFQKSFEYLSRALNSAKEVQDNRRTASALISLGFLYDKKADISENKEDYDTALEFLNESLNLYRRDQNKDMELIVLNNIGHIHIALEKYSEALSYLNLGLEKVKTSEEEPSLGILLTNIGDIQLQLLNYEEAETLYLRALQIGEKLEFSSIIQGANFGLAKTSEELKKFDRSISYYLQAIKEIEDVRKKIVLDVNQSGYIYSKLEVYEHLVNLYFTLYSKVQEKEYGEEMFFAAEKGKARSFLDNLEESQISISKKVSDEYENKESDITNRISKKMEKLSDRNSLSSSDRELIEKELFEAEDEFSNLLNQMLLDKVDISNLVSPRPFNLNYLQERYLDSKTVLVEYFLGEKKSFLFFISKNILKIFELPSQSKIKDSIKAYLKVLTDPSQEIRIVRKASRRLYSELFMPLDDIMPEDVSNLIIIPDGILYYLPFETLLSPSQDKLNENDYLISRYAISYMPSASSLLFLDNKKMRKLAPKELLIFGAPDYSAHSSGHNDQENPMRMLYEIYENQGYQFLPLPYSRREIKKISGYFPKKKTDIFLRKEASEDSIKRLSLDDYRVIHFACHSFLDETFPMRSALVLALDENFKEDGFLKVREIYNLNMNAELIVLSACRTGQGKMEGSDGVLGLPRIFFYAGAQSVVSTLWGINDKSTVDFMDYFYQGLYEGKSKAQALQGAKIKMIKSKYSHPYYWGAFILNGEYRSTITLN
ncbi:CHAT domain-containing protein, partial [Acidobacteriota bacterium]